MFILGIKIIILIEEFLKTCSVITGVTGLLCRYTPKNTPRPTNWRPGLLSTIVSYWPSSKYQYPGKRHKYLSCLIRL